ncbi:TIGR02588 family protein [Ramlibacter sp. USB13]|uniref:TIGR02588 family protein n=1 Tax=Ramlibacter cellulosilyticus TaxID=2764187 RepID=A0A923MUN4_9BURK|nr:TIGR02588 family protein [Ramlibacter cellulosilyticus]MBC5784964.1 TIGR02588 family protein [Ramlibacter cellulosilyticus]
MGNPDRNGARGDDRDAKQQGEAPPTVWEWIVAAIGAVLVAGTLVFLVADALRGGEGPPDPVAEVVAVTAQEHRFHVRVRVRNRGPAAAENLRLAGTLSEGGRVVERADTEFAYVPPGSSREAGLFFTHDPAHARLELSLHSYQAP